MMKQMNKDKDRVVFTINPSELSHIGERVVNAVT